jgi:hypothetical protein
LAPLGDHLLQKGTAVQRATGRLLTAIDQVVAQLQAEPHATLGNFLDQATPLVSEHAQATLLAPGGRVLLRDPGSAEADAPAGQKPIATLTDA